MRKLFLVTVLILCCVFFTEWYFLLPSAFHTTQVILYPTELQQNDFVAEEYLESAIDSLSYSYPIGILTHRPNLLENLLVSLQESGVNIQESVSLFFQHKSHHAIIPVAQKYNLTYYDANEMKLRSFYKFVLESLFDNNPWSNYSIIFEDDLIVSKDFLHVFNTLIGVMDNDPSVFCVSGWYDGGHPAQIPLEQEADIDNPLLIEGERSEIILRVNHFAGLGWATSRRIWNRVKVNWDKHIPAKPWDTYMASQRQPNEVCLVPMIPRTHHTLDVKSKAITVSPVAQKVDFDTMVLRTPATSETIINTDILYEPLYTERLLQVLERGIFVKCRDEILLHYNKITIVYFDASKLDAPIWTKIMDPFGLVGKGLGGGPRGNTHGVVMFRFSSNWVFAVCTTSAITHKTNLFDNVKPISNKDQGKSFLKPCTPLNYSLPEWLEVIVAPLGQSCTDACYENGMECSVHELVRPNIHPQKFTHCDAIVRERELYNPSAQTYGTANNGNTTCFYTVPAMLTCDAQHPQRRRICTCITNGNK